MIKQLFAAGILSLVLAGIIMGVFHYASIPLTTNTGGADGTPAALLPELILLGTAVLVYFFLVEFRLVALIGLMLSQTVLFLHDASVTLVGREFPTYSLIAFNSVVFLALYFMFSQHLWAPDKLNPEDIDPG